jgi:DNA-binding MarR family transcriptional regulator
MKKFLSAEMRVAAKMHHVTFLLQKQADIYLQKHHSLSFMQALILNIIKHHPSTTQAHIVQCTRFTPGAVSRQIEVLHEKGMVERQVNENNRRAQEIDLTNLGKQSVEHAFAELNRELQTYFAGTSQSELVQLDELLSKVILSIDPEYYQFRESSTDTCV